MKSHIVGMNFVVMSSQRPSAHGFPRRQSMQGMVHLLVIAIIVLFIGLAIALNSQRLTMDAFRKQPATPTPEILAHIQAFAQRTGQAPIQPGFYQTTMQEGKTKLVYALFLGESGKYTATINAITSTNGNEVIISKNSYGALTMNNGGDDVLLTRNSTGQWSQKGAVLTFAPAKDDMIGIFTGDYGVDPLGTGFALTYSGLSAPQVFTRVAVK